ncbi:MAG TPA: amidohydrolase family protein [Opitutaceae bacterium]|nr:amidohydrolase family protein [Opitutaceae bacterium]
MPQNPPPDPHPRTPQLKLPALATDCHAHVFGPFDTFPTRATAYEPALAPFSEYVRMLRTIGCGRAVLVQPGPYGTDHSAMLAALRSGEFPLRGVALYNDALTDAQLEELHHFGVQGARIHIPEVREAEAILPKLPRIAARVRRFGWHLQFYLNADIPDIDRAVLALPVPVVLDHFGRAPAAEGLTSRAFETLLRFAKSDRCWFKLSAPYRISTQPPKFPDVTPLARALVAAAPGRCVWGTDWPHPNSSYIPNDGDLVDMLANWIPDPTLRHKVLVENPAELYGF